MAKKTPVDAAGPLVNYFEGLIPLNKMEKKLVLDKFQHRLFRKRQYVLQEEEICT